MMERQSDFSGKENHEAREVSLVDLALLKDNFERIGRFNDSNLILNVSERIVLGLADKFYDQPSEAKEELIDDLFSPLLIGIQKNAPAVALDGSNRDASDYLSELLRDERARFDKQAAKIPLLTGASLDQIGLSLSLKEQTYLTGLRVAGEFYFGHNFDIELKNGGKYISFLKQLDPEIVAKNNLGHLINGMSSSLELQLDWFYDLSNPSDEALELLVNLDSIVAEYERLGVTGERMDALVEAVNRKRQGILKEHLIAVRNDLYPDDGGKDSPVHWFENYDSNSFLDKWNETLDNLNEIKKNPKAADFYHDLKSWLIDSVGIAATEIKISRIIKEGDKQGYLNIIYAMRDRMESGDETEQRI